MGRVLELVMNTPANVLLVIVGLTALRLIYASTHHLVSMMVSVSSKTPLIAAYARLFSPVETAV